MSVVDGILVSVGSFLTRNKCTSIKCLLLATKELLKFIPLNRWQTQILFNHRALKQLERNMDVERLRSTCWPKIQYELKNIWWDIQHMIRPHSTLHLVVRTLEDSGQILVTMKVFNRLLTILCHKGGLFSPYLSTLCCETEGEKKKEKKKILLI